MIRSETENFMSVDPLYELINAKDQCWRPSAILQMDCKTPKYLLIFNKLVRHLLVLPARKIKHSVQLFVCKAWFI